MGGMKRGEAHGKKAEGCAFADKDMKTLLGLYDQIKAWARKNGCGMKEALVCLETIRRIRSKEPMDDEEGKPDEGARERHHSGAGHG